MPLRTRTTSTSPSAPSTHTVPPNPPDAPAPVRHACGLWVLAVAAGVFETVLAVGELVADGSGSVGELGVGVGLRLGIFAAAVCLAVRMRAGRQWARVTLALGLGVVGTASLVVEPLQALLRGESLATALTEASTLELLFGASRALHVTAVLTAVALMFLPAANAYFRTATGSSRSRLVQSS